MTEDISTKVGKIIQTIVQQEKTREGTLENLALSYEILEDDVSARKVARFMTLCKPEIEFFRKIAESHNPSAKPYSMALLKTLQKTVKAWFSSPILSGLRFDAPFKMIEGVAVPERRDLNQLSGPFFIAVAGNFSDAYEWNPKNRSFLFSLPDEDREHPSEELELRILSNDEFKNFVTGQQGQSSSFKIELNKRVHMRGDIKDLFQEAVINITKYALGPNCSPTARDAFYKAIINYDSQIKETPLTELREADPISLAATQPPLVLAARTPGQ